MSTASKAERSLVSHEDFELVKTTHHPDIYQHDADALRKMRTRLRDMRDKERTLARTKRREARGKGAARGESFPGTAELPQRRKQVLSSALKRVNKELHRIEKLETRARHAAAARRALELRQSGQGWHRPRSTATAADGMRPRRSTRRRTTVPPAKVGSVSQQTKNAQAKRDKAASEG